MSSHERSERERRKDAGKPRPDRWLPLMPRIREKTVIDDAGCWTWIGPLMKRGYARIYYQGKDWLIHRAVYTELVGPIPEGMQLDHHCENKACCNPDHMEVVTNDVNLARAGGNCFAANARKTHCKRGHEFTEENTRRRYQPNKKTWARFCLACQAIRYEENKDRWYAMKMERRRKQRAA